MISANIWSWVIYNSTQLKITSRNDHRTLQGMPPALAMPQPGRCPALTWEQLPQSKLSRDRHQLQQD